MEKELTLKELEELKGKVLECDGARIKTKKLSAPVRVYCDKIGVGQYGYCLYLFKNNEIIIAYPLQDIDKLELKEAETKKGKEKNDTRTTKKSR